MWEAGEAKWGTDEEVFIKIFAARSNNHLKKLDDLYTLQKGHSLIQAIDNEFSGGECDLLKTILHSRLNPADFYATKIYKACKGWGTDEEKLIRTLITNEGGFMNDIKEIYEKKYGITLENQIISETSGNYGEILKRMINP